MGPIILASCASPPVEPEDDPLLADELRRAGCDVAIRPWTDLDPPALDPAGAVILRSTWDYPRHAERFFDWLNALERARIPVLNPPCLVRAAVDKSYLLQDRPFGCAAPVTIDVPPDPDAVLRAVRARNWKRFVVKPPVSAGAEGTFLLDAEDHNAIRAALEGQPARILVQEFIPEICEGELSIVFFDGWFSHAVRKVPAEGDFRVQSEFGSRTERARPAAPVIAAARQILSALPERPCYARVDGIMRGDTFLLMELELIEPELFLKHMPGSAEAFAAAILRCLKARTP